MDTTLISRPDEQLTVHCRVVAERSGEPAGWIHDLPKATRWCQRYLAQMIDETRTDLALKNHARLAGYVAFYCARQRGATRLTAYAEAIAIAKHHGNVPDASSYVRNDFPGLERWVDIARRELTRLDLSNPDQIPGSYNTKALAQAIDINTDDERRQVADYLIGKATDGTGSWSEFYDRFEAGELQVEMRGAVTNPIAPTIEDDVFADGGEWYERLLRVYAAIQFADASAAGTVFESAVSVPSFPVGAIDEHLQAIRANAAASSTPTDDLTDALNAIRTAVQHELVDRLRTGVADDLQGGGVARLSLPTGYGKTLSAGLFAEQLFDREPDRDRRLCYALPFTTVADQTATVFKCALAGNEVERWNDNSDGDSDEGAGSTQSDERHDTNDADRGSEASDREGDEKGNEPSKATGADGATEVDEIEQTGEVKNRPVEPDSGSDPDSDIDPDPLLLSIDHHRAETPTDRVAEQQDVTTWDVETIFSAWRPRVTITTTVQLLESVVGPFRSQSRKLPALDSAIIVIDEPQAIPIGWRPLVARAIETLVERDDAIVLLMTATQPFLLNNGYEGSVEAGTNSSDTEDASAGDDNDSDERDGSGSDRNVVDLIPAPTLAEIERTACKEAGIEAVPNRVIYEFHESALPEASTSRNDHADRDRPPRDGEYEREYERGHRDQDETENKNDTKSQATGGDGNEAASLSHAAAGERIGAAFAADREPALAICNTVNSTRRLTDALETSLHEAEIEPLSVGRRYDELIDRDSTESSRNALTANDLLEAIGASSDVEAASGGERDRESGAATVPVFHLTRRVPAAKLSTLIEAAATLAERGVPHLVVSTQLVEAGVDISYQRVYRDFAPLDSIVQAAGRCNRSFEWGIDGGRVYVWALEPLGGKEGSRSPAEQVYATDRADVSVRTNTLERSRAALEPLASRVVLREADLREAVETYHTELSDDLAGVTAADDDLLAAYERGDGRTLRFASLIEERFEVDVVVCMTMGDRQLVSNLREHIDDEEWAEATEVRRHLTRLSVAVPVYSLDSDRWRRLAALQQLTPAHGGDERVIDFDSELLSARDGIRLDETDG
jgi:hypothetical protein